MVRSIPEGDGEIRVLGSAFKFKENALAEFRSPPLLAEHTDDVLSTVLGLDAAAIASLHEAGTVV
jgi:crotonobetainyl-CoA:carnitine CoA-transferase CaiB-like acyl-CoA transferase